MGSRTFLGIRPNCQVANQPDRNGSKQRRHRIGRLQTLRLMVAVSSLAFLFLPHILRKRRRQ